MTVTRPSDDPARRSLYRKRNRKRILERVRVRDHRVTERELRELDRYDGRCAICKREPDGTLCLDHDHGTGELRGFLCRKCNSAIGFFNEDANLVFEAFMYLEGYR